jgi:TolB-like protein/DNA-binding winged helix-turn-helix (wHTH) protein/Flp pilus assembly protein TadD
LLCGSAVVTLTPKAFDTLHLLVRNSGHLLEKDVLVRMLWPDSFVEEGNLTNNIFLLRKALGQEPEYIETVPKKGYRFVGAVRRLPTAGRPDTPDSGEHGFEAKAAGSRHPPVSSEPTRGPTTNLLLHAAAPPVREQVSTSSRAKRALVTAVALVTFGALAYIALNKAWIPKHQVWSPTSATAPASVAPAAFAPPPHSIAVLPLVNMSGDKEQEYFSDGLTEELLNSLSRINELQVAARTSSFYFKGKDVDLSTIAHKLNVASVLEGSVRRAGNTIRISMQLNDAVTGFHLWSQTYDRELRDVLKMQSEIANAVASALKVTLLPGIAQKIELGGTRNPAALDAYLRASRTYWQSPIDSQQHVQAAIDGYTQAIRLDPTYALAFADRSNAFRYFAASFARDRAIRDNFDKALADAREAVRLAPELAEAHLALAVNDNEASLNFAAALVEFEHAMTLAPGSARVVGNYGRYAVEMGRTDEGLAAARRAVALDPLNPLSHNRLGYALLSAHRFQEAVAAYKAALALSPNYPEADVFLGVTYYVLGDFQNARAACEAHQEHPYSQTCLALTYEKLGRYADAQAALAKLKAGSGGVGAYWQATIYAHWGDKAKALEWLETALRMRDSELFLLKTDPLMDPLRKEPRFHAVMRELKFPE